MTKIFNRLKYKHNQSRKSGILSTLFFVVLGLIAFFVVVNIADLFSGFISGKGTLLYGDNIKISNTVLYGVCMGQFNNEGDAESCAASVKQQGGAGYINQAGDYFVYASMYDSYSDATSVKKKLTDDGMDVKIINISIPAVHFNFSGNTKLILSALNSFKDLYMCLYQTGISYDGGTITAEQAKSQIAAQLSGIKTVYNSLKNLNTSDQKVKLIASALSEAAVLTDMLNTVSTAGYNFNSEIKNTYFEIIFCEIALCKAL